jgi:putative transposase
MRMQVEPVAEAVVMEVEDQVTATAPLVDKDLVAQLVGDAQRLGLSVEGEGGLLAQLTKLVLESALEGEMTAHLGYDKHQRTEDASNARKGTRSKTVLTKAGPVEIAVPRDRAGSFEPVVVAKRQRRLGAIEDVVLSLSARGMTHGDISAHLADVYGSEVSKTTISTITDKVLDSMGEWQNRPLDPVYPVVFIDAIHVKVRDGQVANRPIYVALAVTVDGNRDILGLWAGDGGEGAKYWQQVLTEIKNRGVADVLMLVCDGLKGLPESVGNVWGCPRTETGCLVGNCSSTRPWASSTGVSTSGTPSSPGAPSIHSPIPPQAGDSKLVTRRSSTRVKGVCPGNPSGFVCSGKRWMIFASSPRWLRSRVEEPLPLWWGSTRCP